MKIENGTLIFSTGKEIQANQGIVGIRPNSDMVTGGYDDGLFDPSQYDPEYAEYEPEVVTPTECSELAEYMVNRWREWGAKYGVPQPHEV